MKNFIYNNTFITSIFCGAIVLLVVFYFGGKEDIIKPQNLILLATFIAIIWYSLETRLLKNATNIANALQAEPLLVLQYRRRGDRDGLYIVNYGKGPAFNIEMQITNIQGSFNFSIPNPNPLGHMEEKVLVSDNEQTDRNVIASITLFFDNFEKKEGETRKRIYKITRGLDGYQIEYIG